MSTESRIKSMRGQVARGQGGDALIELGNGLAETEEGRREVRELCLRELSENPKQVRAKLLLARVFYLDGMKTFCLRELEELKKLTKSEALSRLYVELSGQTA